MGKIIFNGEVKEVSDGDSLIPACEELGIPFGCTNGVCQTCRITIVSGEDNLTKLTPQEEDLEMNKKDRLACQCKLKSGEVTIKMYGT